MSTAIQWTDATWNPAVGCTHISPGCDHCYAAGVASRQMQPAHVGLTVGRRWNDTVRTLPDRLGEPLKWRKPRRVFVGSMTDLFHNDVPDEFIVNVFATMALAPQHTFQLLTKRPQRAARWYAEDCVQDRQADVSTTAEYTSRRHLPTPVAWDPRPHVRPHGYDRRPWPGWPLPNVWLGTSIESQTYAWRARHLAATPAAVRFLSIEPLITAIDLTDHLDGIHWVIVGCESGPGRRPCPQQWVRDIKDQCAAAGVALFVKQLAAPDGRVLHDLDDFPPDLKLRQWPT